jgi:hypothetical protein
MPLSQFPVLPDFCGPMAHAGRAALFHRRLTTAGGQRDQDFDDERARTGVAIRCGLGDLPGITGPSNVDRLKPDG